MFESPYPDQHCGDQGGKPGSEPGDLGSCPNSAANMTRCQSVYVLACKAMLRWLKSSPGLQMKKCITCKDTKKLSEFNIRNRPGRRQSHQSQCKACQVEYAAEHYRQNKERYDQKRDAFRVKVRDAVAELKKIPCMDCGGVFPSCAMDFDHRGDKHFAVSQAPSKAWSKVLAEIAKCDIVCSNCHRIRTFNRSR